MDTPGLKELIHRYNNGQCSSDEMALIESWYMKLDLGSPDLTEAQIAEIAELQCLKPKISTTRIPLFKWVSAAAALLLISLLMWTYWQRPAAPPVTQSMAKEDARPGSNRAILSLANGRKIELDENTTSDLIVQQDIHVQNNSGGSIVYTTKNGVLPSANKTEKNTMSTPRGGQYRLTLSDGTRVWLNAASSITYPVYFGHSKREVTVTGEVYFEVNHNGSPFIVSSRNQQIEVLGTKFNINDYNDEPYTKTTLLEGSVAVKIGNKKQLLRPGQQAIVTEQSIETTAVDLESEIAWKEGDFVFNRRPVKELMKDIARWYDVQLDYTGYNERGDTFTGAISRSRNLSAAIKMLEKTNSIKFHIADKRLYVTN